MQSATANDKKLRHTFDKYARMTTLHDASFDQIGQMNQLMDLAELVLLAREFGVLPHVLRNLDELKATFHAVNISEVRFVWSTLQC